MFCRLPPPTPSRRRCSRRFPPGGAYSIVRWRYVLTGLLFFRLARWRPGVAKRLLRAGVRSRLPPGYDVDRHFAPRYEPWDQRLCVVPDGDLFQALRDGKASVVTDRIETFTDKGIRLASGEELTADVVVSATGLNVLLLGGMTLRVDGEDVEIGKTLVYKGMMLSGVPNFALTI